MLGAYPLKPVITSNSILASLYDDHPDSVTLTSGCLTPAQAAQLLEQGVIFDTVVLLNGEGDELMERLVPREPCDQELFARVTRIDVPVIDQEAVVQIHRTLKSPRLRAFFASGG